MKILLMGTKKAARRHVSCCLFARLKALRSQLLSVVLIRNGELLAAMSTTRSEYATTILGLHTLTETVLVNATAIVWLECSFHFIILFLLFFPQFGMQKYINIFK